MNILEGMLNESSNQNTNKGKIVYRNISELIPNTNNFYSMNDIEPLAESIKEGGLMQPILIVEKEEGTYIHSGHRRIAAMKLLFEKKDTVKYIGRELDDEVPCIMYEAEDTLHERISIIRSNSYRNYTSDERVAIVKSAHELWNELIEIKKKPKGREREWITALTGISDGTVKKILAELGLGQVAPKKAKAVNEVEEKINFYKKLSAKLTEEDLNDFLEECDEDSAGELLEFVTDCKNMLEDIHIEVQGIVKKVHE